MENHANGTALDQPSSLFPPTPKLFMVTLQLLCFLMMLLALAANGLAFLVFYKKVIFRKILSNRLVINLMVFNTVSCVFLFPAIWIDTIMSGDATPAASASSTASLAICIWSSLASSVVTNGSLMAMVAIGVDQYLAILHPLEYSTRVTQKLVWQLIGMSWAFGCVASTLAGIQMVSQHSPWASCRAAFANKHQYFHLDSVPRSWLAAISIALFFVLPMSLIAYIYLRIFCAARRNSITVRKQSIINPGGFGETATPPSRDPEYSMPNGSVDDSMDSQSLAQRLDEQTRRRRPSLRRRQFFRPYPPDEETGSMKNSVSEADGLRMTVALDRHGKAVTSIDGIQQPAAAVSPRLPPPASKSSPQAKQNGAPSLLKKRPLSPPLAAFLYKRRPRAPKLSILKNRSGANQMTSSIDSADSGVISASPRRVTNGTPKPVARGLTHHPSDASSMGTPSSKRKCSFSSFSECRLVDSDGERHQTFVFSIEAPSPPSTPPATPTPSMGGTTSNNEDEDDKDSSKSEREVTPEKTDEKENIKKPPMLRHQDSLEVPQSVNGPMTSLPLPTASCELSSLTGPPSAEVLTSAGASLPVNLSEVAAHKRRRFSQSSVQAIENNRARDNSRPENSSVTSLNNLALPADTRISRPSLKKSGSLLSMTSQAARRLSCQVSRRASSVYNFFHYKEEFRTAKISTLVVILALLTWTPYYSLLALMAVRDSIEMQASNDDKDEDQFIRIEPFAAYYIQASSNLLTVVFASISPYVYVFRSEKVQRCLRQIINELCRCFHQREQCCKDIVMRNRSRSRYRRSGRSFIFRMSRTRSLSCPTLPESRIDPNANRANGKQKSLTGRPAPTKYLVVVQKSQGHSKSRSKTKGGGHRHRDSETHFPPMTLSSNGLLAPPSHHELSPVASFPGARHSTHY